jgi:4-diphosphocytidyl-2-C-methyl-D-erythritol kinase
MKLLAPAKINLYLRILGRRPDGYHDIETLMVPVSLADDLILQPGDRPGVELICDQAAVPTGADNLIVRAANLFCEVTGHDCCFKIQLTKRIPMGAGLGGGSSDAATVLKGLNVLTGSRLSIEIMEQIAAKIGSDVAWFIRGVPAICRGRGELIEQAAPAPEWPLLLIKPPFGVPTPWAYKAWGDLGRTSPHRQHVDSIEIFNDLEAPVFRKFVMLPAIKSWLLNQGGVRGAAMSGSGSTLFAILESPGQAQEIVLKARETFGESLWCHICQVLTPAAIGEPNAAETSQMAAQRAALSVA